MWEHFWKGGNVHLNKKITPKNVKLEFFNSMFYCKDLLESGVVMKF